jgi:D-alanyl-D-alanine carboxypeptidase
MVKSGATSRLLNACARLALACLNPRRAVILPLTIASLAASPFGQLAASSAQAAPFLVIDQDTGSVLASEDPTEPWYPASLTKLMTAYVVLDEIRGGRLSLDSLLVVSAHAASQSPSKMGFRPGTVVTVDNALKMLLVKSANDIAVTIAEGIGGSVDGFSAIMNRDAQRIGMMDSHFENPNGLPNAAHYSSAQDLAILARALLKEFPDYREYFGIGAISLNGHIFKTYNNLFGRYPGVDGMKTGFICAGGFNTVVSATRGGRHLIAVVLGQPSASVRAVVTAALLDKAFASAGWSAGATVASLTRVGGPPPDMHAQICGRRGKRRAVTWEQEADVVAPCVAPAGAGGGNPALETLLAQKGSTACGDGLGGKTASPNTPIAFDPVPVYIGPAPGSGSAIQPPGTLATLGASPALAAKAGRPTGLPGEAAAYTSPGADSDSPPGSLKQSGTPVHLHSAAADTTLSKTAGKSTRTVRGKHGAKLAATTAAGEVAAPPTKRAFKGKGKKKLVTLAQPAGKTKGKKKLAPH